MPRALARRIVAIYGVHFPGQAHGALEWFRKELLSRRGLDVPRSTFHRWATGTTPDEHLADIEDTLEELADEAERNLRKLKRRITEAR